MRTVYTLLLYLATPIVLFRLAWRGWRAPAYWQRWGERFGFIPVQRSGPAIWIHAVSVGEAVLAAPLIRALHQRYPTFSLVVTTTTPTGSERIRNLFGGKVFHVYAPYDLPGPVRRFLARTQTRLAIIMETELWPNWFHHCHCRGIPVIVANARISPRSARGYLRIRRLIGPVLQQARTIAVQTEADRQRILALGASPAQVRIMGNMKFDVRLPAHIAEQGAALREVWGSQRSVWIAASTHEGEEEIALRVLAQIRAKLPDCLLILVPRHPERFPRVENLCRRFGYSVLRRSQMNRSPPVPRAVDVFLGDTMGELPLFYASADVAFVGGSLVPVGGHNPLEPAALGLPVLFGPHMFNFQQITELFLEAHAAVQISTPERLAQQTLKFLQTPDGRQLYGARARALVAENRGALERLLRLIEAELPLPSA